MGVNFNTNDPSSRQARASIYGTGGPISGDGPILQPKLFNSKLVKGEVLDVDYRSVDKDETKSSDDAHKKRLASQAANAKIFLSSSRPGTTINDHEDDVFVSEKNTKTSSLNEWQKQSAQSIDERLSNLESQVKELRELIGGKNSQESASIFESSALASDPDSRYRSSNKQYSTFIPDRSNNRNIAEV